MTNCRFLTPCYYSDDHGQVWLVALPWQIFCCHSVGAVVTCAYCVQAACLMIKKWVQEIFYHELRKFNVLS